MCTAHINFTKHQNYYYRKYNGLCCKLIRRRETHYWSLQASNRMLKISYLDNDPIAAFKMLNFIYRNKNYKTQP